MNEVRVFDAGGNLKRIISVKELLVISDANIAKYCGITGERKRIKFKNYTCVECKKSFKSNSTRGAKYCPDCRKGVYTKRKRNAREAKKL